MKDQQPRHASMSVNSQHFLYTEIHNITKSRWWFRFAILIVSARCVHLIFKLYAVFALFVCAILHPTAISTRLWIFEKKKIQSNCKTTFVQQSPTIMMMMIIFCLLWLQNIGRFKGEKFCNRQFSVLSFIFYSVSSLNPTKVWNILKVIRESFERKWNW